MLLPFCRHRGLEISPGHFQCFSPFLLVGPGGVTGKICQNCPYVDMPDNPEITSYAAVEQDGPDPFAVIEQVSTGKLLYSAHLEGVKIAHRLLIADEILKEAPYPGGYADKGIVICAGGWRFFTSLYITVRMIRHLGCTLPIQVWYLGDNGEFEPVMQRILRPFNVSWIDGQAFARDHSITRRCLGGWELKPFAIQYSSFQEVLLLDADCYPVQNPEQLFNEPAYLEHGSIFWPDGPGQMLKEGQWQVFGMPFLDENDFETGQILIDKAKCWKAMSLTNWLNDHSDFVYQHVYGDKSTFHLAWRMLKQEYAIAPQGDWVHHSYVHKNMAGQPVLQHRCRDKFRLGTHQYASEQHFRTNRYTKELAYEDECFGFRTDLDMILNAQKYFRMRSKSNDIDVWNSIILHDEYPIPATLTGHAVLDIGAHIGAFSWLCLQHDAKEVLAAEAAIENGMLCRLNIPKSTPNFTLVRKAAWRSDKDVKEVPFYLEKGNYGGSTVFRASGKNTACIRFDDLIDMLLKKGFNRIRLVKIDCEGSEYPILFTSSKLHLIDEIVGEYHPIGTAIPEYARIAGQPEFNGKTLMEFLQSQGFIVHGWRDISGIGLFQATRKEVCPGNIS